MKIFRVNIYAKCNETFKSASNTLFKSQVVIKYPNCVEYFKDLWKLKDKWAYCFRKNMLIRGSHTNNYVEAQFLVIKDTILKRQRQYNINMLLIKLVENFEDHFKLRLISAADGTFDGIYSKRFKGKYQFLPRK